MKSACILCTKPDYDGTHFCRACLLVQYPPVSGLSVAREWSANLTIPQDKVPTLAVLPLAVLGGAGVAISTMLGVSL
jgi:hypothetical protein